MIGKQVVFDDGLFEVTLIKTPKNPLGSAGDRGIPSHRAGGYQAYVFFQDRAHYF